MEMIGQHDYGVDRKRKRVPSCSERRTQNIDVINQGGRLSIEQRDREEICGTCDEIPPVPNHIGKDIPDFAALNPGYNAAACAHGHRPHFDKPAGGLRKASSQVITVWGREHADDNA